MQASEVPRAVAAATSTVSSLDLTVDDAIVLHDSNKLTLRLLPGEVLARVAPIAHQAAQFEIELAERLTDPRARWPLLNLELRHASMSATASWSRCGPTTNLRYLERSHEPTPPMRSRRLHAGMRKLDIPTPHFTDRVEQAQQLVASRDHTPALADADRELLGNTSPSLRRVIGERGGVEQLPHGQPHPGNVLTTKIGLLFIDLEKCCRGPVEFDLAHAPEEISEHHPGVNQGLLGECRILVLAMITTWRWDRGDALRTGASWAQSGSARSEQRSIATAWIPVADREPSRSWPAGR